MNVPAGTRADATELRSGMAGFTREWAKNVANTSYVPLTRVERIEFLRGLAEQLGHDCLWRDATTNGIAMLPVVRVHVISWL